MDEALSDEKNFTFIIIRVYKKKGLRVIFSYSTWRLVKIREWDLFIAGKKQDAI